MDIQLEEYERRHLSALRASSAECTLFLKRSGKLPLPGPGDIALYGSGGHRIRGGELPFFLQCGGGFGSQRLSGHHQGLAG